MNLKLTLVEEIVSYTTKMVILSLPFSLIGYGLLHGVALYYTPEHIPGYMELIQLVLMISIINIFFHIDELKDSLEQARKRKKLIEYN